MRNVLPMLLICASLAGAAPIPEKPALPTGPAPFFQVVQASGGNYIVTSYAAEVVTRTRTKEVQVGDKKVQVPEVVDEVVLVPVKITVKGTSIKVYDADGNLVPPADAAARLKDETLVVMSADGKMVDPAFRALLSRKALILVSSERAEVPGVTPPGTTTAPSAPDKIPPPPPPRRKDF